MSSDLMDLNFVQQRIELYLTDIQSVFEYSSITHCVCVCVFTGAGQGFMSSSVSASVFPQ